MFWAYVAAIIFTVYLFLTYLYNCYKQLFIYTLDYIVFYTEIYLHMVSKGKYKGILVIF